MIHVIGTGPSALAATLTLIKRNLKVTVIDVAKEPEKKTKLLKNKLKKKKFLMELKKYMKMKLKQVAQVFINLYLDQIFFMRRIIHLLKIKKKHM